MDSERLSSPQAERELPSGTVAFLFTDIEGSTVRWDRDPIAMREAVRRHDALLKEIIIRNEGYVFKTLGDAFCAAFWTVESAMQASLVAQRALAQEDFASVDGVRVRIAVHVGISDERDGDYFGPTLNRVARLLAIGHGGQVLLSSAAADAVRASLPSDITLRDLGDHRLKDLTAPEHVFQLIAGDLPTEFPKLRSLSVLDNNLPQQLTSLVGREDDVAKIKDLLKTSRLVTLGGAGGVGKTRCALQVAADSLDGYQDGVWFADLAPISDPALIPNTIGAIFELQESPNRAPIDTLVENLKNKQLLLILDNCEHLIHDASKVAATLLRACPNVKLLATSREALNLPGESVYRMPSLAFPARSKGLTPEDARSYGAIALFEDRARTSNPRFALADDNAAIVADVCRQLDGIPFAIELAAARMKMLSPAQLAQRLSERFRILTGGDRTALPRQQTMRALIDWSYDLLTQDEQRLFRCSSIFTGGFTLQTATAVATNEHVEDFEVLDHLASLVDKSLVLAEPFDNETRYRLLESTRQYAREKLAEHNEEGEASERHAKAYTELAEQFSGSYETDAHGLWLEHTEAELENIRAALTWTFASGGDEQLGERLAATLYRVFGVFAAAEAYRWIKTALERVNDGTPPEVVAGLALGEAFLLSAFNQMRSSLGAAERALTLFTELGDRRGISEAQRLAGRSLVYIGRIDEGRELLEQSLAIRRTTGSKRIGGTLRDLAAAHGLQGDVVGARALITQAAAEFEEGADDENVAITAATLAEAEFRGGDVEVALRYAHEALAAVRALGRQRTAAAILGNIAAYLVALDRFEPARDAAREALDIAQEVQIDVSATFALQHLAAIASLRQPEDGVAVDRTAAAHLIGYVDERLGKLEAPREYTEKQEYDRAMAELQSVLGSDRLAALMEEGRHWSQEHAFSTGLHV